MKLGIFAKTFARPMVEEVFAAVARLEVGCVQFNLACAGLPSMPDALPPGICERIAQAARHYGCEIAALSGTFNMCHPERPQRRDGLRRFEQVAAAAAALGCPLVTLCTGTRDATDVAAASREQREGGLAGFGGNADERIGSRGASSARVGHRTGAWQRGEFGQAGASIAGRDALTPAQDYFRPGELGPEWRAGAGE